MDSNEFKPAVRNTAAKAATIETRDLVKAILDAAWSKNGFNTRVYDVAGVVDYTDIFIILSGRSDRHVMAIAEAVEGQLKASGIRAAGVEGRKSGAWVLLDFGNVIVHVFEKHNRDYYDLDRLWVEAKVIEVQEPEWVLDFARMEASQFD
jgi:ribosome-associated protein